SLLPMHSSASRATEGTSSASRACDVPNLRCMSELRNEPRASAASSGTVIMASPAGMLDHSRPTRVVGQACGPTAREGTQGADDSRPEWKIDCGSGMGADRARVMPTSLLCRLVSAVCLLLAFSVSAAAVPCGSGSFEGWLESFKREAAAQGISQRTIVSSLGGVHYDPKIVSRDHAQGVFRQSFEQFAGRMVSADRLQKGASLLRRHAALFSGIEQRFGVPGPILVAIWGLETDFGVDQGRYPTIQALATLAYD